MAVRSAGRLVGKWFNELGSCMNITAARDGMLHGKYETAVGIADKTYDLTGRYDTDGNSLGWTVTWNNCTGSSYSTTGWSGQYQLDPCTKEPRILTTWLLTAQTNPSNDWNSTNIGADVFQPVAPPPDTCLRAKHSCQQSHPKAA